ncbi:hypothetical protein BGZ61DRAFT_126175 [Ilyonectria robusta]|uniref:uncharacterized protein n=1 Tax=Ilyonectria robusta TaxID=1079257 RepID=UPI001E8E02A4|nr:uncharacterized protein BGZ61DRAFT_126175 [Ilyonectria robusta]KAH8734573.1 hypothetical protein BGZ61DRAFT_126175 [Ilyonectria robusta]
MCLLTSFFHPHNFLLRPTLTHCAPPTGASRHISRYTIHTFFFLTLGSIDLYPLLRERPILTHTLFSLISESHSLGSQSLLGTDLGRQRRPSNISAQIFRQKKNSTLPPRNGQSEIQSHGSRRSWTLFSASPFYFRSPSLVSNPAS